MTLRQGREFLSIPGPTNIPELNTFIAYSDESRIIYMNLWFWNIDILHFRKCLTDKHQDFAFNTDNVTFAHKMLCYQQIMLNDILKACYFIGSNIG